MSNKSSDLPAMVHALFSSRRKKICCVVVWLVLAVTMILSGIFRFFAMSQADFFTSAEQVDSTLGDVVSKVDAGGRNATVLSAYFGLDDTFPPVRLFCASPQTDGMPLVLSHQVDPDTLQAGDFLVTDMNGRQTVPSCVTLKPAVSPGELRTVLLMGEFGTAELDSVCIVGNLLDMSRTVNFQGSCIRPKPIAAVVDLVFAMQVPESEEPDCGEAKAHVLRVTWDGGVTLEDGLPVPADYASKYSVTLVDGTRVTPSLLGDINDRDNNHLLCFSAATVDTWGPSNLPVQVDFEAGHFTDPNEDGTNQASSVVVTQATTPYVTPRLSAATVAAQTIGGAVGVALGLLVFYIICCLVYAWCQSRRKSSKSVQSIEREKK